MREDAGVGLAPPHHRGVAQHGEESRQVELLQTRSQVAGEIGHDPESVASGESLQNRTVACHDLQRLGVQPLREYAGVHAVGQEPDNQSSLRVDRGTEPERPNTRQARERSEEHTSELQSPCNLVCRLLLEKKKKNKTPHPSTHTTETTRHRAAHEP